MDLGCDISQQKAIERICKIKNIDPQKAQLSFICRDLSHLSDYTKSIDTPLYRLLKQYLPGHILLFYLQVNRFLKFCRAKNPRLACVFLIMKYARCILDELGNPLLSASLPGEMVEEYTDPEVMHENFEHLVDFVIDGGSGGMIPSTVVDCTTQQWEVLRQGLGVFES